VKDGKLSESPLDSNSNNSGNTNVNNMNTDHSTEKIKASCPVEVRKVCRVHNKTRLSGNVHQTSNLLGIPPPLSHRSLDHIHLYIRDGFSWWTDCFSQRWEGIKREEFIEKRRECIGRVYQRRKDVWSEYYLIEQVLNEKRRVYRDIECILSHRTGSKREEESI
jgi:hypothetical protein